MAEGISSPQSELPPETKQKTKGRKTKDQNTTAPIPSYEDRCSILIGDLIERLDREGINLAIICIIDPKIPGKPIIHTRGHTYQQASTACNLARHLKQQLFISEELSV